MLITIKLTQLSSRNREILIQDSPLLDALGVGCGLLVDAVDALLNSRVNGSVAPAGDLGHACAATAQFTTKLHRLGSQFVFRNPGVTVYLTLRGRQNSRQHCTTVN